jgi:CRP-like cAMP-binding protein
MNYFYFPTTCIVATLHLSENGDSTAISVIGNEGMTNIAHVLGAERTLNHEVVQSTGIAYRLSRSALMSDVQRDITLQPVLLRYAQSLLTQIAQTSVCNCHHQTPQRMCRLLLQLLDRLEGTSILMTHELIANMLGVRREGISDAANKLQQAGAIVSSRGKIVVLDRKILSSHCCECYEVVKEEELRLLATQNTMAKVTQYPARLGLR